MQKFIIQKVNKKTLAGVFGAFQPHSHFMFLFILRFCTNLLSNCAQRRGTSKHVRRCTRTHWVANYRRRRTRVSSSLFVRIVAEFVKTFFGNPRLCVGWIVNHLLSSEYVRNESHRFHFISIGIDVVSLSVLPASVRRRHDSSLVRSNTAPTTIMNSSATPRPYENRVYQKWCCCIRLETFIKAWGWISIIGSVMSIGTVVYAFASTEAQDAMTSSSGLRRNKDDINLFLGGILVGLVIYVACVASMVVGVNKVRTSSDRTGIQIVMPSLHNYLFMFMLCSENRACCCRTWWRWRWPLLSTPCTRFSPSFSVSSRRRFFESVCDPIGSFGLVWISLSMHILNIIICLHTALAVYFWIGLLKMYLTLRTEERMREIQSANENAKMMNV